jgi:hypothetical protein
MIGSCPTYSIKKKEYELPYAAGHYVPQLAELVYARTRRAKHI